MGKTDPYFDSIYLRFRIYEIAIIMMEERDASA